LKPLLLSCLLLLPRAAFAIGQPSYVEDVRSPGSFRIEEGKICAPIYVDASDNPGVIRAVGDLQSDVTRVTDCVPLITHDAASLQTDAIVIGTLGKSQLIDQLFHNAELDAAAIANKWESLREATREELSMASTICPNRSEFRHGIGGRTFRSATAMPFS